MTTNSGWTCRPWSLDKFWPSQVLELLTFLGRGGREAFSLSRYDLRIETVAIKKASRTLTEPSTLTEP